MLHKNFNTAEELIAEAARALAEEMSAVSARPRAVILSGGSTPMPVYEQLARLRPPIAPQVYFLHGDERMVPIESDESNYGNTRGFMEACGILQTRFFRMETEFAPEVSAARFDAVLRGFLESGGLPSLALLGLGDDGHTLSFFRKEDIGREESRLSIAVEKTPGNFRVTITPPFLRKSGRILMLVTGEKKRDIARAFLKNPEDFPAGVVTRGTNLELWTACGNLE